MVNVPLANFRDFDRDACRLWLFPHDELPEAKPFLTEAEFSRLRPQSAGTRAVLRILLSKYFPGVAPKDIPLSYGVQGKPILHQDESNLQFNISHTSGWSVFAFSQGRQVGVDVENSDRRVDLPILLEGALSPAERASVLHLSGSQLHEKFFELWTLKESYLKARGDGLHISPKEISFTFRGDQVFIDESNRAVSKDWHFRQVSWGRFRIAAALQKISRTEAEPIVQLRRLTI